MPPRQSAGSARPRRPDRAESVRTSPGRSLPAARSFPFISELLHFDSRRRCGGRGVRSLGTRRRSLSRRYRLSGDGFAGPDLDIGNHPLDAGYASRVFGDAIEFGLRARRADQVDRAVDRFDRVIDRANLTVERKFRPDLSGNPRVFGALTDALSRRHFDLVVNYSHPRDLSRGLFRLGFQFRVWRHAGQQHAPLIDSDIEIALHQRVRLQPGILDTRLGPDIVKGSADAAFLVRRITRSAGGA